MDLNERLDKINNNECPECGGRLEWMYRGMGEDGYAIREKVCMECPWDFEEEQLSIFTCDECGQLYYFDGSWASDAGLCKECYGSK